MTARPGTPHLLARARARWPRLALPAGLILAALAGCAPPEPAPLDAEAMARIPAEWAHPLDARPVVGERGMVAADEPLAARVGADVLAAGGNAVDAAVATAFALAATYPEAGNLGGGGFLVLRLADGTTAALDFREAAPAAASRDMFLDEDGEVTDRSLVGHLASGVPGSVAGLWEAHLRYGTLPWAELIEPAVQLAEDGFVVDDVFADGVRANAERLGRFPASAELFLPGGAPLEAGSVWRNPDLAATLRRIADQGPPGFYAGETADLIVAEMRRGGGLISHEDLRAYRAVWREPIEFTYRGMDVVSMPPVSSGGITLGLMARILEGYDLGALGWNSPEKLHLVAEAMRRAFADRNHYLGDPDFVEIPRDWLLSPEYAADLRATISPYRATPSEHVGPLVGAGLPAGAAVDDSDHTTHFSVVDGAGNAVALTTTINSLYGSKVTVAGAGFLLNNEMDDFTSKPGEPNQFGLVQGEANAIEPGKRMLSAMTPTIAADAAGQTVLVTGARGGPRIITAVFQVLSNVVDHDMALGAAVNAPRVHHQHLPDSYTFEPDGLTEDVIDALTAFGHDVQPRSGYIGVAPTILRHDGRWHGLGDRRRGGAAYGY